MFWYRIPGANEAIVVTGKKSAQNNFRILTGKGQFVFPFFSKAHSLSLDLLEAELNEPCVTTQGIQLGVQAVAVFKVGNDEASISNAARRFMDQQGNMRTIVGQVLAGHLRSVVGGMTVEDIIRNRNVLASQVKDASSDEMEKMGLEIDSLQIREIQDPSNYIDQLRQPHMAAAQRDARIATAQANQEATEKEQAVIAQNAVFTRDAQIAQAKADGEAQAAKAQADQEGPLATARAQQAVAQENANLAKKNAEVTEATLESTVRKPADASKYQAITQAEGEAAAAQARAKGADAVKYETVTKAEGERDARVVAAEAAEAEAKQIETLANARAAATKVESAALGEGNVERQVTMKMVEQLPDIVRAAAESLQGANLTVLNGADGVGEMLMGVIANGKTIWDALMTNNVNGNGHMDPEKAELGTPHDHGGMD